MALENLEEFELESVDISSTCLHGELKEEVYMKQPEGFERRGPDYVCRLLKAIYGLKQAGRMWHIKLNQVFEEMGFSLVKSDHSIWIWRKSDTRIIIPVFVDDMTIAAKDKLSIQWVKDELAKRFTLHDMGPTNWLLGVHIQRDRSKRSITLSQRQYILDMLDRYGFANCSPVKTPMDAGTRLSTSQSPQTQEDHDYMARIPYFNAVGALMWLAIATRPDILYAVGVLCRCNSNPGIAHWKAVKHLMQYVKSTIDVVPPLPLIRHLLSYSQHTLMLIMVVILTTAAPPVVTLSRLVLGLSHGCPSCRKSSLCLLLKLSLLPLFLLPSRSCGCATC